VIIERYIIRNYVGPFFFSLSVITFVFIMDFILRYIDLFLNKGVDFLVVLQAFILSLGHMFALIIPMAVLPATLMTFGSLAAENEITAMKASGISLYRMIMPGAVMGLLLTIAMIWFNNNVLPESNHRLLNLLIDINRKKPTVEIRENTFIDSFAGHTIYIRKINDKTGEMKDVQIFRQGKKGEMPTTIVAEKGHLVYLQSKNVLRFELENGEIHEMPDPRDPSTYRRTHFKNYIINISDIDRSLKRSKRDYRGDREMSTKMMLERIHGIQADIADVNSKMTDMAEKQVRDVMRLLNPAVRDTVFTPATPDSLIGAMSPAQAMATSVGARPRPAKLNAKRRDTPVATANALKSQIEIKESYLRQINRYRVEIQKKYSIPFACLIFVLIGSPIALRVGRSGMNVAIAASILVFLVYYVCLIGGEKLADRRIVNPVLAMWIPNIIFGLLALWLIRRTTLEQGAIDFSRFNPLRLLKRSA